MSKGKVVNGESVGVGSITESFTVGPTGRRKEIKTSQFLRKGENPSKRPTPRQSEIDDTLRLKKSGQMVEPQVSFLNGKRCKYGTPGSIRVDNFVNNCVAHEMKNYDLTNNTNGLINEIVRQAKDHQIHLPEGARQVYNIDVRGQVCDDVLQRQIRQRVLSRTDGILTASDIRFVD